MQQTPSADDIFRRMIFTAREGLRIQSILFIWSSVWLNHVRNCRILDQGPKNSELLLVSLPLCTRPTVKTKKDNPLALTKFYLVRTSGRVDSLDCFGLHQTQSNKFCRQLKCSPINLSLIRLKTLQARRQCELSAFYSHSYSVFKSCISLIC